MKKRVLFLLAALSAALLFCSCGKVDKPKLRMATNAAFPPYEFVKDHKIDGIDPKIVRTVAERIGYEVEIYDMNFDAVITAVQSGKADIAASGITITEERRKRVNFTFPYVVAKQMVVVRVDSPVEKNADLADKRIGVQHGTTGDMYVSKNIKEPERFSDGPMAIAALLIGKVDVVVIDNEPAKEFLKKHSKLRMLKDPLTYEEYAFAFNKRNPELLAKFNEELEKMIQSGEVNEIIEFYVSNKDAENKSEEEIASNKQWDRVYDAFYSNFVKDKRYMYLVKGFGITLYITVFAVLMGIVIGFFVAVVRSCADQTGKFKWLDRICRLYLTVIRGTPVVVQLLIIYFVIFGTVDVDKVLVAVIAFGINSGAYVAEIIRSGIMALDKGQMEAGRSLGLSYNQTMRSVILPQAFKNVLPALGNEFIVLLKETSVSGYIALRDLTKGGDIIRSQTYNAFLPLIAVALIYLLVVIVLTKLLELLERKLKKNE